MDVVWDILLDALRRSLHITGVVAVMMTLIELINLGSKGRSLERLRGSHLGQIILCAFLGATPGCMGGFASVSLYTHGLVSFGSIVAMLIATSGDESFTMFAMFPGKAALLTAGLFVLAVAVGYVVDLFVKRRVEFCHELEHEEAPKDRFKHVLHHLPSIFLWTFGVLLALGFGMEYLDLDKWIGQNTALMIVLACLVGLIPESGPHLVFVTLFASGVIPAPVLIASCICQDGHAALPLLAHSRRSFLVAKGINFVVALAVGFAWWLIF